MSTLTDRANGSLRTFLVLLTGIALFGTAVALVGGTDFELGNGQDPAVAGSGDLLGNSLQPGPDWADLFNADGSLKDVVDATGQPVPNGVPDVIDYGGESAVFLGDDVSAGAATDSTVLAGGEFLWDSGVVASADDLGNAYVYAKHDASDNLLLYLGAERLTSQGATYVEFEFNWKVFRLDHEPPCGSDGYPFSDSPPCEFGRGYRNDDDLKVRLNYAADGSLTSVEASRWGVDPVDKIAKFLPLETLTGEGCTAGDSLCAFSNASAITGGSWDSYDQSGQVASTLSARTFVESAIDVGTLVGPGTCYGSVHVRTPQDMASGFINTCSHGGDYTIDFQAARPTSYGKYFPPFPACGETTDGSGYVTSDGREADPINPPPAQGVDDARVGVPVDAVESLAPKDLALGQIVPFEIEVCAKSGAPVDGAIEFNAEWKTETTSNGDFGYDHTVGSNGVYCAFVDTTDAATTDADGDARVDRFIGTLNGTTIVESFTGTFEVSGLDPNECAVVEIWLVLDETIPPGVTGNVQSKLVDGTALEGENEDHEDTINTGNQTVPLLRVQEFFSADADVSVVKSDDVTEPVTFFDQFTYDVVVTNHSTDTVANSVVATDTLDDNTQFINVLVVDGDDPITTCTHDGATNGGVLTCDVGALLPGEVVTITITVEVLDTAPVTNTGGEGSCVGDEDLQNNVDVTALTDDPDTSNNSACEPTAVQGVGEIAIVKDASPTSVSTAGETITYTYTVTNEGNIPLTNVTVVDDNATPGDDTDDFSPTFISGDTNSDGVLDLDETWIYEATVDVTQAQIDAGDPIVNTATADSDESDPATDTATVTVAAAAALTIVKTASPATYSAVGDLISYSYLVTNTGNVTISQPITIDDDIALDEACPTTPTSLAPTETITCTASHTITQPDLDAGSVTNVASATGKDPNGDDVTSPTDTETVTANQNPALTIVKTASPATYSAVGDLISYSYLVTNTGNVTISQPITIDDDIALDEACPTTPTSLAPTETITCTASHTITQPDLDAGSVTNVASATGKDPNGDDVTSPTDTETVTANQNPALTIVKTASPATYSAVGDLISYSYLVTNTGNVTISQPITIDDDIALDEACPTTPTSLAPTETITCTASHTITQPDLDAGSVTNVASATGKDPNGDDVTSPTDTETVTANQNPALTIVKTASPATYSAVGDLISYSYLVTNTGNVTISQPITIDDDIALDEACPTTPTSLAPTETITCTASHTITQPDLDAGSVTNVASATGKDPNGDDVTSPTDTETVTANQNPALTIVKTASPATYSAVGDLISYSYLVTNTGNVTISQPITIDDDIALDEACPTTPTSLAPTETITCTASHTITQPDLDAGSVTNVASATGKDPNGDDVTSPTDTETVTANQNPALTIVKTASPATYSAVGDLISYSYLVTNTGNVTISQPITIDDDIALDEACPTTPTSLAPTETITCTASHTITQPDLDAGSVTNVASATGKDPNGDDVTSPTDTETVTANQNPALTIVKTASPATYSAVGDLISYSYLVTNTGNVTISQPITIDDDIALDEACPTTPTSLAPTETITCTASHTITQPDLDAGSVTNVASATGKDPNGDDVTSPTDTETVTANQNPALTIVKTASLTSITEAYSGNIDYTFEVENTGNVTLYNVDVVDPLTGLTTISCTPPQGSTLAPDATMSCTASLAVVPGDYNAGDTIDNTATTTGDCPDGTVDDDCATASDDASVLVRDTPPNQDGNDIVIAKTANPVTVPEPGGLVTFTVVIENKSTFDTMIVNSLIDDVHGDLNGQGTCAVPIVLDPGDPPYSCSFTASVNGNAGYFETDTANAIGTDDDGSAFDIEDDATVTVINVDPTIVVTKTANPTIVTTPGQVVFTVDVENTSVSSDPVIITSIMDTIYGNILDSSNTLIDSTTCTTATILPGNTYTCTFTVVKTEELALTETDVVTVCGNDDELNEACDDDDATVTFVPEGAATNSSLCLFDIDGDDTNGRQFRDLFTQDAQNYPKFKLTATNPGQFFYNMFYYDPTMAGQSVTVDVEIPYPFITQGAMPVHVYDDLIVESQNGDQCFVPGTTLDSQALSIILDANDTGNPYNQYGGSYTGGVATTLPVQVIFTVPTDGFAYVNIHLDYGLKGRDPDGDGDDNTYEPGANNDANDPGTADALIPNLGDHVFSHAIDMTTIDSDVLENLNEFKRNPGVAGLTLYEPALGGEPEDGAPLIGKTVVLYRPSNPKKGCNAPWCEVGRSVVDEDGFYQIVYKHKGRAEDFKVSIIETDAGSGNESDSDCGVGNNPLFANLKGNAFKEVNFFSLTSTCGGFTGGSGGPPSGP